MKNFFKSIGAFIDACVDYLDERVRTGKFIGDINGLSKTTHTQTEKKVAETAKSIEKSKSFQTFERVMHAIWEELLRIPLFGILVAIITDGLSLLIKYYADFFLIFTLTFPTIILLDHFFESSLTTFFIIFPPIFFWNVYCMSVLYYCVHKRKEGEKISLWNAFGHVFSDIGALIYTFSFHLAIIMEVAIGFAILALFYKYFFDAMDVAWSGSFFYWFGVIFVGLLVLIALSIVSIILQQTYFLLLLEKKKLHIAFKEGWQIFKSFPIHFVFFYMLIYIAYGFIFYWATLYYLYFGIAIVMYFFIQKNYMLGYLFNLRFRNRTLIEQTPESKPSSLFMIVIIFGVMNYVLISVLVTRQFDVVNAQIEQTINSYFLSEKLIRYSNATYNYTIEYPKNWTKYEWSTDSVTFYNNYTGTINGGTWLNITVSPYADHDFKQLYSANPGLVSIDTETKDITTKVSNISIQGNPGVAYLYTKTGDPYDEHQTHYLIHKNNYQYDIKFTTLTNTSDDYNADLFERVIGTLRFIQ